MLFYFGLLGSSLENIADKKRTVNIHAVTIIALMNIMNVKTNCYIQVF